MPTVVNGIGTWYYGKRRIHTRKGTCEFCGHATALSSYDTTLFFVVFFVPLIPLSRKRILEQCSVCQKHRVMPLSRWEEAKVSDAARVLDNLQNNPHDRQAVAEAIGLAMAYQDEPLFQQIIEPIAGEHQNDAAVQQQMGDAYTYFARWPQAEEAYRAALAVEDSEFTREGLAWALLKQGRSLEAQPYLQHILDNRKQEGAGLIYYLVQGYQAEGMHEEALALMDERDQAFPEFVNLKEYQQQRKTSTRYRGSEKRIRSSLLEEKGRTGYRSGGWTAKVPRWIVAGIFGGALALYLGSAIWIGMNRKVFLVNGTSKAYTVSIAGQEHVLPPNKAIPVRVAEGVVEVAFADARLGLQPIQCTVETSFWSRPFTGPTFVINPDQAALVIKEETVYAEIPPPPRPPEIHLGQTLYSFSGLNYEFEEFPRTLQASRNQTITKTRVALGPPLDPQVRFGIIAQKLMPQLNQPNPDVVAFCDRLLRLDPSDTPCLYWLYSQQPPEKMVDFLKLHLDDRPPLIEWHRIYQTAMERVHPETDLRPYYQKLLTETNGLADVKYLLARAEPDWDKADKLFREAATAQVPSPYAMHALAFNALSAGKFAEAVGWSEKAMPLLKDKTLIRHYFYEALWANRDYERLLTEFQKEMTIPGMKFTALADTSKVHAVRGEKDKARAVLEQAVQGMTTQKQTLEAALRSQMCCWENDLAGYLRATPGAGKSPTFEVAFLKGDLEQAAAIAKRTKLDAGVFQGLLYLAARRAKDDKRAQEHWKALLAELKKDRRDERLFADLLTADKLPASPPWQRLGIEPRIKRVYLAVLAQRFPAEAKEILALARTLDFHRDAISLCLQKVMKDGK